MGEDKSQRVASQTWMTGLQARHGSVEVQFVSSERQVKRAKCNSRYVLMTFIHYHVESHVKIFVL
jgi:hypothetical protein